MTIDMNYREVIRRDNEETLRKFRAGESLSMMPPEDTWYPPRPKIKKDPDALQVVHKRHKSPLKLVD
jgi:hypothetical protein